MYGAIKENLQKELKEIKDARIKVSLRINIIIIALEHLNH